MHSLLIVEDNQMFRRVLYETLETGCPDIEILEAGTGYEALKIFESRDPEIVFLDLDIPPPSGLMLINSLKDLKPDCCVVVLTNHDGDEHREAAKALGADLFFSKSDMSAKKLIGTVKSLLQKINSG